jgi:hypothetical protein
MTSDFSKEEGENLQKTSGFGMAEREAMGSKIRTSSDA